MTLLIRLLLVASLGFATWWYGFRPTGCGTKGEKACAPAELEEGLGETISAEAMCPTAGYLCAEHRSFQIRRWSLDKSTLRVRILPPDFLNEVDAKRVRDAAIEGIQAWEGHPYKFVFDTSRLTLHSYDVGVVWTQELIPLRAGVSSFHYEVEGKRGQASNGTVVLGIPPDGKYEGSRAALVPLTRAVAAHEMGHVLGLGHSDSTGDVMYWQLKKNPAQIEVSTRDYKTVDALYELPNGAAVQ